jgi:methyl-accepting chemotaxis protein
MQTENLQIDPQEAVVIPRKTEGGRRSSLATKFILRFGIIMFIIGIVQAALLINSYNKQVEQQLAKRGHAMAINLAYNAKFGVTSEDAIILNDLITGVIADEDVGFVIFRNMSGKVIAQKFVRDIEESMVSHFDYPAEKTKGAIENRYDISGIGGIIQLTAPVVLEKEKFREDRGGAIFEELGMDLDFDLGQIDQPAPAPEAFPDFPDIEDDQLGFGDQPLLEDDLQPLAEPSPVPTPTVDSIEPVQPAAAPDFTIEKQGILELGVMMRNVDRQLQKSLKINLAISFLLIFVGILIIIYIVRTEMNPINELVETTRLVAAGNLNQNIELSRSDEVGELAEAFNKMSFNLKDIVARIREAGNDVTSVAGKIGDTSKEVLEGSKDQNTHIDTTLSSMNEMNSAVKAISQKTGILSKSAEESSLSIMQMGATIESVDQSMEILSGSVEETSSAIEQMAYSIRQVSENVETLSRAAGETATSMAEIDLQIKQVERNTGETSSLSDQVQSDAEKGMKLVQATLKGIENIKESSSAVASVVDNFGTSALEIGSILDVINDIAEQTNLLALNAAIIAAQAGDHGRSFAVVAEEIKTLAERTTNSTKEIANLISAVQNESKNAIDAILLGQRNVDTGEKLAIEANSALQKIYESATLSSAKVNEITQATIEQAKGSNQITGAIEKIATMTEQIAKATNEQKQGSEQVMRVADNMREIAGRVRKTTKEQAEGSKMITKSIEEITSLVNYIDQTTIEQSSESEMIVNAIENIKNITTQNLKLASEMDQSVDVLNRQANVLIAQLRRFKT